MTDTRPDMMNRVLATFAEAIRLELNAAAEDMNDLVAEGKSDAQRAADVWFGMKMAYELVATGAAAMIEKSDLVVAAYDKQYGKIGNVDDDAFPGLYL